MRRTIKKYERKFNRWKNAPPEDIFIELIPWAVRIGAGIIVAFIAVSLLSNYMSEQNAKNLFDLINLDVGFFFNKWLEMGGLFFALIFTGLLIARKKGYF